MEEEKQIKRILVLGGSSFVGLTLLKQLSEKYSPQNTKNSPYEYKIYYINRGKTYWNGLVKTLPNLQYINGNRNEKREFAKLLEYTSKKYNVTPDNKWVSVIDFSAFKWQNVKSCYEGLKGLVEQYIFISTDSVYDCCQPSIRGKPYTKSIFDGNITMDKNKFSGERITEDKDIRYTDPREIKRCKKEEDYGHAKLQCEEYMQNELDKKQFPFIILRWADVIGPYDDTGRCFSYVKWITELNLNYPIQQDKETKENLLSFVFSQDIVKAILYLIENSKQILENYDQNPENSPLFKPINLACDENLTMEEFVNHMYQCIPQEKVQSKKQLNSTNVSSAASFFPSVDCGPIEIARAKKVLNWEPTPITEAIRITTEFFLNIMEKKEFKTEEKYAEQKLNKKLKR